MQPTMGDTGHWYVVHCRPSREQCVATLLNTVLHLEIYVPQVRSYLQGKVQDAPLFPGYLFVRCLLSQGILSQICTMPGVLHVVSFGNCPEPVPPDIIITLRQRVDELNRRGGIPNHSFEPGTPVRLKEGPLGGLEAIFLGPTHPSERVRVLIEFLGRLRELELSVDLLEASRSLAAPRRERYTRGKGRVIKKWREEVDA